MKIAHKSARRLGLQIEQLESRFAMAGGFVTVDVVSGSNLKITGDDQENHIAIFVDNVPEANTLHIEGRNGTTVVVKDGDTLPDGNLVGKIDIDLKKALSAVADDRGAIGTQGVDTVEINNLDIASSMLIKGKNGGVVHIEDVFARKTTIDFDLGNGVREKVNDIELGSLVEIFDSILGNKGGPSSPFPGGVFIYTKDCRDHVEVRDTNPFDMDTAIEGTVTIKTKGAIDEIGLFDVQVHSNFFNSENRKLFSIDSGKGDDLIAAQGLTVNGKTKIVMSDGIDHLFVGGVGNLFVGTVSIDTGKQNDTIGVGLAASAPPLTSATFNSKITLKAGNEDDRLMIGHEIEFGAAKHLIDGGKHIDTLETTIPATDEIFKNWEPKAGVAFSAANFNLLEVEVNDKF